MTIEKAIAAALEPIVDDVVALEKRVASLQLTPGPKGDPGTAGADADPVAVARALAGDEMFIARTVGLPGEDGIDGAGIDAPAYQPGEVYRCGTTVTAHIGQHFVAIKDTADAPGDSPHWRRLGGGGFRHRGTFDKDAVYIDGDLFVKDWGTFCVVAGTPVMLAGRGATGKTGDPGGRGEPGQKGRDGRDGATLVAAQVSGFKLVLVVQDAAGNVDHFEADFTAAFREVVREAVDATVAELRDDIGALKQRLPARRVAA